ncbi:McrC family protein [Lysobacter soli]|uniref:McrC family protein n=1 Tax=Lysobacter soli TaxID=453783 RepID=UPI0037C9F264
MAPHMLTAGEHQTLSVGDGGDLTSAEAAVLASLAQQRRGFCTLGHRSLKLAQYVGLVNLGGRVLEVLPKIGEDADAAKGRGTLLRLLRLAYDLPVFEHGGVGHGLQQRDLLDVFVLAYLRALLQLVRAGLLRRYRTEEDDLGVVRGRMMLGRQVAVHAMRIDRVACRFDELSIDNPWNQVLKAALFAARPWARGLESGRLWLEMAAALDGVSVRRDALELLAMLVPDRQVHHYTGALRWAGWILKLLSPDLRGGGSQAPELLFDMNRLFEASVAALLRRRAFAAGWHLSAQDDGFNLATLESEPGRSYFRLRPDLVLREGTRVLVVADTKWSRLEIDRVGRLVPDVAHVYQLHAYASVYPCEEVTLIYPWHRGLEGAHPTAFRLPACGTRQPMLRIICIDVAGDDMPFRVVGSGCYLGRLT